MRVKITQIKSVIGSKKNQKETIKALGLNKIGKSVEKDTNEMIEGMIKTVSHLIEVSEIK
ncbi:MAG: 50S ribosomal protein L30 [Dehalococcoidia bacterium]|nr:50S ribosomal protein L30 [Dehalococcoidia bacterium]MBH60833.1 50S ribosomal protein L30 [Dehalococcoidia bacterium]MEC7921207.1 50S ribosomal protein L30 [Chloroflexota bacterium]MEC9451674.1 50S ribosomal protein L30 [Chloroflexota bacterium]|tara:strand:+ start:4426 stop:4605 length:180 start_codon:yes stop_codon:yes gene_type:complete